MRFAGSLIFSLLAVNGLAQTVVQDQDSEPSVIAAPEPSAPAAEPSAPAADDDTPQTQDEDTPEATADPQPSVAEPTADEPAETADASQVSDGDQPTATASDDDDDDATATAEETATADATATDDEATATATDEDSTDTATLTATSSSAPTSTSAVVDVNLNNATIGDNAELIKVDGKPAIKLSAPAGGQASFSVEVDTDDDFSTDELIYIVASILVGEESDSAKLRRRATKTDCTLQIQANGQSVYSEPLTTTNGKFEDVTSSGINSSENPQVQVTQKCGDKPSPLTVNNVRLGNESGVKSSSGGGSAGGSSSGGSGSGSGSGRGGSGSGSDASATTTGSGANETGDSNMGAKAKASLGALGAAILAAAALV